ncbi:MAG: anhydro-N-acetylmuramic acid kinase [Thiobacillaceae bacterium]|nr:anhydro-N-acetylmuramic acid kinase [Thiobacillaceae bacterium]MCX7673558.1 anhydro-N-acetylmuramic acid kinase [Thiobacillaceae bacterium]MDW8323407.1 anhydro-N-acetylmuramic acid kinase [Burkholderiales bacterium]
MSSLQPAPTPTAEGYYIGLMSGPSLDGVDAVLVRFARQGLDALHHLWLACPPQLRRDFHALEAGAAYPIERVLELGLRMSGLFAEGCLTLLGQAGVQARQVQALGCHGPTLLNRPQQGYCLQLNQPAQLAERTGITVVTDFPSRDIAAGGQGTVLTAAFLDAMLRPRRCHGAVALLGGIAHLIDLPVKGPVRAFDCGPGTLIMDAWVQRHWGCDYDPAGGLAAQGRVLEGLLQVLLVHPYFALPPPKSAGRETFTLEWLQRELSGREREEDVLATLLELTARVIANAVRSHCAGTAELWVAGGGAHNEQLLQRLAYYLPGVRLGLTDALGLPVDSLEACALAWLARQTLRGLPGNVPEATGARGPRILGAIHPA